MKTIINKLRYTLLLGFIAIAALGNSLNAQTVPPYSNGFNSTTEWNWWTVINNNGGNTWDHNSSQEARYTYDSNQAADDWLVTSAIRLEAGKIYKFSIKTKADGYTERIEVKLASSNTATALSNGTSVIAAQNVTNENYYTLSNDQVSVSTTGNYYFGIHCISIADQWHLYVDDLDIDVQATDPTIQTSSNTVNLSSIPGGTANQTVTVTGLNLTEGITITPSGDSEFSVSPTSLGTSGGNLTVTYSPSAVGTHTATVTLTSSGADPVTITLNGACTNDLTICDGTVVNTYLPIYSYYYDNYQKNQMIYPEGMVSALSGRVITSMTFYANGNFNFNGGQLTVRLGTTNQTNYTGTVRLQPADMDIVKSGFDVPSGGDTWTIVFDTPFEYYGGNLVVDFEETNHGSGTGHYSSRTFGFYGITQTGGGFYSNGSTYNADFSTVYSGGVQNFLPKVTFTSEVNTPITNGTVTPNPVDFGNVLVGSTATQTVTVRNTGNQPFTPTINATNLPQGITVSPTTSGQLAPGSTLNLTVTFTPTAETSYSGSFTVTIPVPDGEDLTFTVTVTGTGYIISSTLTSQTVVVPVYKSDIQAPSRTYVFSREDVENDTLRTLNYSDDAKIQTQVLVKNEEPVVSYDLHRKAGSGNWTYPGGNAVAQAVQQSSPSTYLVDQETFTIPQDATQLWVPMTDEGVDASSELLYVPVTVADGVVTRGNTYGAPQVAATSDGLTITFEVTGSKSAGGVGGNWDQTLPNGTTENYCVYSPVITITSVDPAFGINTRLPYMFRAWLLVDNSDIYYYDIKRVPNTNDPTHGHIVADSLITQPKLLGTIPGTPDMVGIGPFGPIGYEWTEDGPISPSGNVKPENVFGAPTDLGNREMKFAVRIYYYKPQAENPSGHMLRAAGDDTPEDGYAYADQDESDSQDIQTAVNSIYGDREVVDVQYVNALGQQSSKPFEGVNIVVTRYSDGTMSTTKVLK